MSGFFEIGIYHPKTEENIGTLWRSAYQLGATGIFTIGKRYKKQVSDTYNTPNNIPLREFETFEDFLKARPKAAQLIAVEQDGEPFNTFVHPRNAIYLLGAEDHGLPPQIIDYCQATISLPSVRQNSFNVAIAGSIIMMDRLTSR